jgi:NTE family protein
MKDLHLIPAQNIARWIDRSATIKALLATSTLLLVASCATMYPSNPTLDQVGKDSSYTYQNVVENSEAGSDVMILLAFSGGGTRAASFSYGVLRELAETQVTIDGKDHRLSDEVDVITSVSGGSFTAAYFGLYGDRIFEDFEDVFLRRDVQGELTSQTLNPANWSRLASPYFTRADMATELYDATIFNHATFADMQKAHGPYIVINATEMTLGTRFQFTQNYADVICTDLANLPVARAVTASSAVPILFSPITLTNHAGECDWQAPAWIEEALATNDHSGRLYNLATNLVALTDKEERPYLHLFDGGLADNLGLRAMLDGVLRHKGIDETLKAMGAEKTRKVVVIMVNSETALDAESARLQQSPTFTATLSAATSVPLSRYSFETVALMKNRMAEWEQQSYEKTCGTGTRRGDHGDCKGVDFHFIEVSFSEHPDPDESEYLKRQPTSFSLTDEAVDRLIEAGKVILRNNDEYRQLLDGKNVRKTEL